MIYNFKNAIGSYITS